MLKIGYSTQLQLFLQIYPLKCAFFRTCDALKLKIKGKSEQAELDCSRKMIYIPQKENCIQMHGERNVQKKAYKPLCRLFQKKNDNPARPGTKLKPHN